jgi:hypothetical protein
MDPMAAELERQALPPPSLCPKCGGELTVYRTTDRPYRRCNRCYNAKRRVPTNKHRSRVCPACGALRPRAVLTCPACTATRETRYGAQRLDAKYPGYVAVLRANGEAADRLLRNYYKGAVAFPAPSRVFPGLIESLDGRLRREQRDKDVTLCMALAALPMGDQREFLELYLRDPIDARHWASLPRWKRPIRKGDTTDQHIWSFFIMQRLNMEMHADGHAFALKDQGYQLQQMGGTLRKIADIARFAAVLETYGEMLHAGDAMGNTARKPWEERPNS